MLDTKFGTFITGRRFPGAFVALLMALTIYVSIKLTQVMEQLFGVHPWAAVFISLVILAFLVAVSQMHLGYSPAYRMCTRISSVYLCFMIYFLLALAICDVIAALEALIGWDSVETIDLIWFSTVVSVMIVARGAVHARRLKTKTYQISLGGTKPYRMVLLSDLHLGAFIGAGYVRQMVDQVARLKPDMVVITGDLFDGPNTRECPDLNQVCAEFRRLRPKDGVYAVLGNHDPEVTDEGLQDFFNAAHIQLLYNEVRRMGRFTLVGRMGLANQTGRERAPLNSLLRKKTGRKPVIILDHDPQGIREAKTWGADLVLCGHTHKGQFFPFSIFTRLAAGKDYFYGYVTHGRTQAVISSGTGFFQLPIRIGSNSEIVSLELHLPE